MSGVTSELKHSVGDQLVERKIASKRTNDASNIQTLDIYLTKLIEIICRMATLPELTSLLASRQMSLRCVAYVNLLCSHCHFSSSSSRHWNPTYNYSEQCTFLRSLVHSVVAFNVCSNNHRSVRVNRLSVPHVVIFHLQPSVRYSLFFTDVSYMSVATRMWRLSLLIHRQKKIHGFLNYCLSARPP